MIVSPSTSLLAAGVVSGICFLLLGSSRFRKESKAKQTKRIVVDDGRCACCLAPFLVGRGVGCSDCGVKSCRKACSRWDTSDNAWRCLFCHQRRSHVRRNETWFENFGRAATEEEELYYFFGTAKSRVYMAGYVAAFSDAEKIAEDRKETRTMRAVRNFVERIVEGLVDNVDNTPIDQLYINSEYDKLLRENRPSLIAALTRLVACLQASLTNKPSTDPPAMAHAALREIVERAVEEARKLPELGASTDIKLSREERTIADRSYEELLATAILNKVIERFQRERVDGNSNVVHDVDLRNVRYTSTENKYGLEKDASFRLECNNDHDTSNKLNGDHQEPVSFMMEERVEEVTTITSDDEVQDTDVFESGRTRRVPFPEFGMDIVDPPRELPSPSPPSLSDSSDSNHNRQLRVRTKPHSAGCTMDLISPIESWEDNWLFQKRKTTRSQPDAVAMLVPSSNTYYKALIGDKDAEDTSDLSECSSTRSDEEIEKELMDAINNVIPRSPRFSECDIESNREMPNDVTEFEKDEVDICQTKIRNNEVFSEYFDERNGKKFLQVSEEIIIKDEDDKEERNESATALVKRREKEDKVKEKFEDRIERDEKITISAMESSPQKNTKVHAQFEKSNERDDRENATNDEQQDEEQRESEYTEHYDTAIQRHLDSLTKIDVCSGKNEVADEMEKLTGKLHEGVENYLIEKLKRESSEVQLSHATIDIMVESDRLSSPPRPGTIAEREHKKWENAPPIENNPYSEESIRRRSWERRYSRKATNIPGSHYEVTKLDEVNVEALLTPDLPDIKRFGRDYYINQSKMAIGERSEQDRSSRPSSSLSQRSSCAGDEQRERQEEIAFRETDCMPVPQEEDKGTKTTLWRRNNVEVITSNETNNRAVNSRAFVDIEHQRDRNEKDVGNDEAWKEQCADDILEDQRKNSKNVINAKLNNQEHNLEVERQDGKDRKVRRIDLRAYGFENEFSDRKSVRKPQRVVNRLDLRFFGYQDGLRRTQSNNQLDQPPDNEKSNLTKYAIDREKHECKGYSIGTPELLVSKDLAKSSRDLNELHDKFEKIGPLISAKSMPNIADDMYYYANPIHANDNDENKLTTKNLLDHVSDNSKEATTDEHDVMKMDNDISCDVDRSFEDIYIKSKAQSRETDKKSPMPSVKKLAETFSKQHTTIIGSISSKVHKIMATKIGDVKNMSSTSEIQIVETPRQMHSLTARSLSREFREGLRQMPGKVTSPPVSRSLIEERPTNRTEIVRSKREGHDIAVISPGKLKSNIMFWEQIQKKD